MTVLFKDVLPNELFLVRNILDHMLSDNDNTLLHVIIIELVDSVFNIQYLYIEGNSDLGYYFPSDGRG